MNDSIMVAEGVIDGALASFEELMSMGVTDDYKMTVSLVNAFLQMQDQYDPTILSVVAARLIMRLGKGATADAQQ